MRKLFALLFASLCVQAQATDVRIACGSSVAGASIWMDKDKVYFHLEDAIGYEDFPLYSGVVTSPLLPGLKRAAEDFKFFKGSFQVAFARKDCQVSEKNSVLIQCTGKGEVLEPSGVAMTPTGLSTTVERNERLDMTYNRLLFDIGLDTPVENYKHYFVTFPFNLDNCRATSGVQNAL